MTSMLCVQEPGGFVEHQHKDLTESILKDSCNHAVFSKYFPNDIARPRFHSIRPFSTPNPQISSDNIDRQQLMGQSMKLQAWLNDKSVRLVQEKSDMESGPVKQMYGAVLEREETFVKDMGEYVDNHRYLEDRKKEILHKNWSERVYEPIRRAIIDQMDSDNYTSYKRRKDQLYREYIEHLNKKGHVFRDDFDPSEYYAMGLHDNRPMVVPGMQATVTKPIRDPTLLQGANRDNEDETILRCTSGSTYKGKSLDKIRLPTLPLVPQGRHGTENKTWVAMPLTDIESPVRQASSRNLKQRPILKVREPKAPGPSIDQVLIGLPGLRCSRYIAHMKRMVGTNLRSELNFARWSTQSYGKETQDKELGIQKRRQCPQPPFTAPKKIGNARKRLPAAKESHKSRTLPFANPELVTDYDVYRSEPEVVNVTQSVQSSQLPSQQNASEPAAMSENFSKEAMPATN